MMNFRLPPVMGLCLLVLSFVAPAVPDAPNVKAVQTLIATKWQ